MSLSTVDAKPSLFPATGRAGVRAIGRTDEGQR